MPDYPAREPYFAHKFVRLLGRTCAAQEIGTDACWLLAMIAHTEDAARYVHPVTFWNDQLMAVVGFANWAKLDRARKKAIDSGWLHYEAGGKAKVGKYWVIVPPPYEGLPDGYLGEDHPGMISTSEDTNEGNTGSSPDLENKVEKEAGEKRDINRERSGRETGEKRDVNGDHSTLALSPSPNPCPKDKESARSKTSDPDPASNPQDPPSESFEETRTCDTCDQDRAIDCRLEDGQFVCHGWRSRPPGPPSAVRTCDNCLDADCSDRQADGPCPHHTWLNPASPTCEVCTAVDCEDCTTQPLPAVKESLTTAQVRCDSPTCDHETCGHAVPHGHNDDLCDTDTRGCGLCVPVPNEASGDPEGLASKTKGGKDSPSDAQPASPADGAGHDGDLTATCGNCKAFSTCGDILNDGAEDLQTAGCDQHISAYFGPDGEVNRLTFGPFGQRQLSASVGPDGEVVPAKSRPMTAEESAQARLILDGAQGVDQQPDEDATQGEDHGDEDPVEAFKDLWRAASDHPGIKRVRSWTPGRLDKLRTRLKAPGWLEVCREGIAKLPLPGDPGEWQPTVDWFLHNDANALKLAEGAYDWRATKGAANTPSLAGAYDPDATGGGFRETTFGKGK